MEQVGLPPGKLILLPVINRNCIGGCRDVVPEILDELEFLRWAQVEDRGSVYVHDFEPLQVVNFDRQSAVPARFQRYSLAVRARSGEIGSRACWFRASSLGGAIHGIGIENRLVHDLKTSTSPHTAEEARSVSFVAGATDLAGLDQKHIAIAVDRDRLDVLNMPRRPPLVPVRAAGARVKMRLPSRQRIPQGRFVHPGQHQNLAIFGVLNDCWN